MGRNTDPECVFPDRYYRWIHRRKKSARVSLQEMASLSYSQRNRVFLEVPNGSAIPPKLRTDRFMRGTEERGRAIRWLSTYHLTDVYARLVGGSGIYWAAGSAQSYFSAGIEDRVVERLMFF